MTWKLKRHQRRKAETKDENNTQFNSLQRQRRLQTTSTEIKTDTNDKLKEVWNTQEKHKHLTKTRAQIKDKSTPASEEADNDRSTEESHNNSEQGDEGAHFPGLQSSATNKILEAEAEHYIKQSNEAGVH